MPLKVRCARCGSELTLHDAFAGATCRCKHCRHIFDVAPASSSASRPTVRPKRPRLAAEASTNRPSSTTAPTPAQSKRHAPSRASIAARLRPSRLVGGAVFSLVLVVGLAWGLRSPARNDLGGLNTQPVVLQDGSVARNSETANLPERFRGLPPAEEAAATYISQPLLDARRVMFVIDASETLAPYYDQVASLTKAAMLQMQDEGHSYGAVLACAGEPRVRSLDSASLEQYEAIKKSLYEYAPQGRAQVTTAFAAAARQRPDRIFLVTARTLPAAELNEIARQAQSVNASACVIALNTDDPRLAQLASLTNGRYASLSRDKLMAWTELVASNNSILKLEKEHRDRKP